MLVLEWSTLKCTYIQRTWVWSRPSDLECAKIYSHNLPGKFINYQNQVANGAVFPYMHPMWEKYSYLESDVCKFPLQKPSILFDVIQFSLIESRQCAKLLKKSRLSSSEVTHVQPEHRQTGVRQPVRLQRPANAPQTRGWGKENCWLHHLSVHRAGSSW